MPTQNIPSNTDAVILELGVKKAISAGDGKELSGNVATISVNVTDVVLNSADGALNSTDVVRNSHLVATDDAGVTINSPGAIQDVVMTEETYTDRHGAVPESGQFLPVEGGYILVADNAEQGNLYFYNISNNFHLLWTLGSIASLTKTLNLVLATTLIYAILFIRFTSVCVQYYLLNTYYTLQIF